MGKEKKIAQTHRNVVGLISFEKSIYYNYTDHLGNFRLSYFNKYISIREKKYFQWNKDDFRICYSGNIRNCRRVAVNCLTGSSLFKSTVIGAYMRTTSSFGQTAGTAVANILMSTPDYGVSIIQNKIP